MIYSSVSTHSVSCIILIKHAGNYVVLADVALICFATLETQIISEKCECMDFQRMTPNVHLQKYDNRVLKVLG